MKARYISFLACAYAAGMLTAPAQQSTSFDYFDVSQGAIITADSGIMFAAGTYGGLLGENGQNVNDPSTWTYFNDGMLLDHVHFVEWELPADVTIGEVRVFAFGDDGLNYGREFNTFTLKTKSPGSDTFDVVVTSYAATHPYTFIDVLNYLVVDAVVTPVTGRQFRAEFTQRDAGFGWDGPRIIEIDGLPVPRPTVNIPSTNADVFDVAQGTVVTGTSGIHPGAGTLTGLFGNGGQSLF